MARPLRDVLPLPLRNRMVSAADAQALARCGLLPFFVQKPNGH